MLNNSELGKRFEAGLMNIPQAAHLDACSCDPLPYYLVGDESFPLKTWLMRPYPGHSSEEQRIFNYRQSRARRVIENAFEILVARWRIFSTTINASLENIESYAKAAVVIHNYLMQTENAMYRPSGFADSESSSGDVTKGHWRESTGEDFDLLYNLPRVRGSRNTQDAREMRESLKDYVNSDIGSLSWQLDYVRRT